MLSFLARKPVFEPCVPPGTRVYAIGDVHGRLDLLESLLAKIEGETADVDLEKVTVVLLGDLIDRGPDSAGVVKRAMAPLPFAEFECLLGNHEALMLDALEGKREVLNVWLRNGGDAALMSWGVTREQLDELSTEDLAEVAEQAIPAEQRAWIAERPLSLTIGDYYFVHAGIRPGVPLDRQNDTDRLWIRNPFLSSAKMHGAMVVHGHSISEEVQERASRIGIDTGAYFSDRLTALAVEGRNRWFLEA